MCFQQMSLTALKEASGAKKVSLLTVKGGVKLLAYFRKGMIVVTRTTEAEAQEAFWQCLTQKQAA